MAITILVLFVLTFIVLRALAECGARIPFFASEYGHIRDLRTSKANSLSVFGVALLARLGALIAMLLALQVISDNPVNKFMIIDRMHIWDAGHYVNLVNLGYDGFIEDGKHLFLVFFPFYVWMTRLVSFVIPSTEIAGLVVSVLSYAGGCCYLYKLTSKLFNTVVAWDAVVLLSAFPFSFFFGTVMTEGLFLLTVTASCYYALCRKWWLYAIFGIMAALTRMTGLLVISFGVLEFIRLYQPFSSVKSLGETVIAFLKKSYLLLAPVLGTGVYLGLNYYVDGDPFAFLTHQKHWNQGFMWVSDVISYVIDEFMHFEKVAWFLWLPTLLLFVGLFILFIIGASRRDIPSSLLVFGFLYFLSNYCLAWLLSAGRYMSCGFVSFIILAVLLENKPKLKTGFVITGCTLMGVLLTQYLKWKYIM